MSLATVARSLAEPKAFTTALVAAHPTDLPAHLAHSLVIGEPPPKLDPTLEMRTPGSPRLMCQRAVHQALSGDSMFAHALLLGHPWPELADWWVARLALADIDGNEAERDKALIQLRLRFPDLPIGHLGLE